MSTIAIITGRIQLKKIEEDPEIYGGKTLATIGFWIGVIRGSLLLVVFGLVILIYIVVIGSLFFLIGSY